MTTKTLLTPTEVWSAKIYSSDWQKPGLGTADAIEKATGAKLGEIGVASTEDMIGAVMMSRIVTDPELSAAILHHTKKHVLNL
jgi:benzaldehyde dehydrogenase (NAD)